MPCIETLRSSLTRRSSGLSDSSLKIVREGTHMLMCPSQLVPGTALVRIWRGSPCNSSAFGCGNWDSNKCCLYSVLPHSPPLNSGHCVPCKPSIWAATFVSSEGLPFFLGTHVYLADVSSSLPLQPGSMLLGSCVRTWLLPNFSSSVSATQNEGRHISSTCFALETLHLSLSWSELDVPSMQSATDVFFPYFWHCSWFGVFTVIPELGSTSDATETLGICVCSK